MLSPFVAIGDFFGDDGLLDAVLVNITYDYDQRGSSAYRLSDFTDMRWYAFENNGVSLVQRFSDYASRTKNPHRIGLSPVRWRAFRANESMYFQDENPEGTYGILDFAGTESLQVGGRAIWLSDFDDDMEVELGVVNDRSPVMVFELDGEFTRNDDATAAIAQATRDLDANLATSDEADFKALWLEHRPSASVTALALIANMDLESYDERLRAQVAQGGTVYEAVKAIRESQGH